MKIYTRSGDKGSTSLFGGKRVSKSATRLHAYGTLDELNAILGLVITEVSVPRFLRGQLIEIQSLLFSLGADLATPLDSTANILRTDAGYPEKLERWIDAMDLELQPLVRFIVPGGSRAGALLHQARTVCRRAERWIVKLKESEQITENVLIVVNRLSDYLFTAARYANKHAQSSEDNVIIPRQ